MVRRVNNGAQGRGRVLPGSSTKTSQSNSGVEREATTSDDHEARVALASRQADDLREAPEDLAEMAEVMEHMNSLRVW
jgi:hypothetical protein